jgi:hypothetical protein
MQSYNYAVNSDILFNKFINYAIVFAFHPHKNGR